MIATLRSVIEYWRAVMIIGVQPILWSVSLLAKLLSVVWLLWAGRPGGRCGDSGASGGRCGPNCSRQGSEWRFGACWWVMFCVLVIGEYILGYQDYHPMLETLLPDPPCAKWAIIAIGKFWGLLCKQIDDCIFIPVPFIRKRHKNSVVNLISELFDVKWNPHGSYPTTNNNY